MDNLNTLRLIAGRIFGLLIDRAVPTTTQSTKSLCYLRKDCSVTLSIDPLYIRLLMQIPEIHKNNNQMGTMLLAVCHSLHIAFDDDKIFENAEKWAIEATKWSETIFGSKVRHQSRIDTSEY